MRFRRIDRATLRPATRMPNGMLRADAFLSRSGVFLYKNPDGSTRREYRPEAEVFKADSLSSFAFATVTDDHPTEPITSENARQFAVGSVGESVVRDNDKIKTSIVVFDATAITKMDAGKVELSCGYECDLDETPGVNDAGERYDAIQRNIVGNHVAIVAVGRAGRDVRVRMDEAIQVERVERADMAGEKHVMEKLQEQLTAAITKVAEQTARADAAEKRADAAEANVAKIEGERDAATARADAADKSREDNDGSMSDRVAERVALQSQASEILGSDVDVSKMSDRNIKCAVVKKVDGADINVSKPDAYVDARYDSAVERADGAEKRAEVTTDPTQKTDSASARAKMEADHRNAWTLPLA